MPLRAATLQAIIRSSTAPAGVLALFTRQLLGIVVDRLRPAGRVAIGMDGTIERQWERRIRAREYTGTRRSGHGHFAKANGLRWLRFMVLT